MTTLVKKARASGSTTSLVTAALNAPLPETVPELLGNIERARKALAAVEEAKAAATSPVDARNLRNAAQHALNRAHVQRQIGQQFGEEDAPSESDIAALEQSLAEAEAALASAETVAAAWEEEKRSRYEALEAAHAALRAGIEPWHENLLSAIDLQLKNAVAAIGEAQGALRSADPWRSAARPLYINRIGSEGHYPHETRADMPADVFMLLSTNERTWRRLMRAA